jgi:hypothetical protein
MRLIFLFIIWILGIWDTVQAATLPFTDVKPESQYYQAVKKLFDAWVISNNDDNLFRPDDLMNRDFYISLTVWIGCKKCNTPSQEDIIRYQYSPFIDLPKVNPYYYCIAYSKEAGITQGYTLDTNGVSTCENNRSYTSSPFCALNTINRIEATAVLLRRANLWNDTLNNTVTKDIIIPDVSDYWYGYAKKGIQTWIINQKSDNTVWQGEKISRGEFAIMAEKILKYTQCELNPSLWYTTEWAIGVKDRNGADLKKNSFDTNDNFTLVPIPTWEDIDYVWNATNPVTWEIITMNWDVFPWDILWDWSWIIVLDGIDPLSKEIITESSISLQIWDDNTPTYNWNIIIRDENDVIQDGNTFTLDDGIVLTNVQEDIEGDSRWKAVEETSGRIVTGDDPTLLGSLLGIGEWTITLETVDPKTGEVLDTDIRDISIGDGGWDEYNWNIIIRDENDVIQNGNTFTLDDGIVLTNVQEDIEGDSRWKAVEETSGRIVTGDDPTLLGSLLGIGEWTITLETVDPKTGEVLDTDIRDISIGDGGWDEYNWNIIIRDENDVIQNGNTFTLDDGIVLTNVQEDIEGDSRWKAVEETSGRIVTGDDPTLLGSLLGIGEWTITLETVDPKTGEVLDTDIRDISIGDGGWDEYGNQDDGAHLAVSIIPNKLTTYIWWDIELTAIVSWWSDSDIYNWDFGDGNMSSTPWDIIHSYTSPGIYTIILTVTDPDSDEVKQSSITIKITWEKDTDSDGILDSLDSCPFIFWKKEKNWCPDIDAIDYMDLVDILLWWNDTNDQDGDWIPDSQDQCPIVVGVSENSWCPLWDADDQDGDTVINTNDACIDVVWPPSNKWCPLLSIIDNIKANACLQKKLQEQWMIFWSIECSTCPCNQSIELTALLRSCDIVFPTILSPNTLEVYSRWGFYTVP